MRLYSVLLAALFSIHAYAADSAALPEALQKTLTQLKGSGHITSYEAGRSAVGGIYEVLVDGNEILYLSEDGKHMFVGGDLLAIGDSFTNLTEERRNQMRQAQVAGIKDADTIVFAPKGEVKHVISIFTDVDCFYCAKLHQEVNKLTEAGVKVRYLAFPRAGAGSETYKTMVSVWCSDNQQEAITAAKNRQPVKEATCANPIKDQYELGQKLGVRGTPALLFGNGQLVPGYVPADKLVKMLEEADKPS